MLVQPVLAGLLARTERRCQVNEQTARKPKRSVAAVVVVVVKAARIAAIRKAGAIKHGRQARPCTSSSVDGNIRGRRRLRDWPVPVAGARDRSLKSDLKGDVVLVRRDQIVRRRR